MRGLMFLCLIHLLINWIPIANCAMVTSKSCLALYKDGVEAYLEDKWSECVLHLEKAVKTYKLVKSETISCRLKCHKNGRDVISMIPENKDDLHFFEKFIRTTLCLTKCLKDKNLPFSLSKETENVFQELRPYEYLHLCYFQINKPQEAASAAYTFLSVYPDHEIMQHNFKYYTGMEGVDSDKVINREAKKYVHLYKLGVKSYRLEKYDAVLKYMEGSLKSYLEEEEECRVYCEGPFDQGWFPDFVSSVSNHFTYCLKCKRKCPATLSLFEGENHDDLLASHFNYLQFSYYKIGKIEKACEAVETYLLFNGSDETMVRNKQLYLAMPEVVDTFFVPRNEVVSYVEREKYENTLLNFIENEFSLLKEKDNQFEVSKKMDTSQ